MATDAQLINALLNEAAERRAANPALGSNDREVAFGILTSVFVPAMARYASNRLAAGQKITYRQDTPGEPSVIMTIEAVDPSTFPPG